MPARDIRRPGHRGLRGFYPSHKVGRTLPFESRLERDHFLVLDGDPAVTTFDEQPVTIEFQGRKRARHYTPDCRVVYRTRPTELVEVKYVADIEAMDTDKRADLDEAHDAARTWCGAQGWRFVLRTDRDIVGPALARAHALRAFARLPGTAAQVDVVLGFVRAHGGVTLAELALALDSTMPGALARRLALHLVWRGRLRDDPFATPTDTTRLFLTEAAP